MEQHPIPRQITTFEFKLVGFMTLKQFIYLVVFVPAAYIVFSLFPIPVLNFLLAAMVAFFGIALAFIPVNDRPLDVFIKNLYKRLLSPTQYFYKKGSIPIYFLAATPKASDPLHILNYLDSQKKLSNYLSRNQAPQVEAPSLEVQQAKKKQLLNDLLRNPDDLAKTPAAEVPPAPQEEEKVELHNATPLNADQGDINFQDRLLNQATKKPFLTGVVKNNRQIPLPGILIYVKDQTDTPIRLLKTNPHGIFATFNPLPKGEYTIEIKDPKQTFSFDTMKIALDEDNPKPLEFYSKELM